MLGGEDIFYILPILFRKIHLIASEAVILLIFHHLAPQHTDLGLERNPDLLKAKVRNDSFLSGPLDGFPRAENEFKSFTILPNSAEMNSLLNLWAQMLKSAWQRALK